MDKSTAGLRSQIVSRHWSGRSSVGIAEALNGRGRETRTGYWSANDATVWQRQFCMVDLD